MNGAQIYCIDSSSLIDGYRSIYPHNIFIGLWDKIDGLVQQQRLIAPEQVYKELIDQDDDLAGWIKDRRQMFIAPDSDQDAVIRTIALNFPQLTRTVLLADPADPWVVALAKVRGCLVVSEEKGRSHTNPKIPQICERFRVSHIPFLSIVKAEGWVFR